MPITLDRIDRKILRSLQRDGRLRNDQLAMEVGLSPSPCLRRVRALEAAGVISRYAAVLDGDQVGYPLTVFVRVALERQDRATVEHFIEQISGAPEVLECYLMAGSYDFLLRVVAPDLDGVQRLQMELLTGIAGVRNIQTEIPWRRVKLTSELPV